MADFTAFFDASGKPDRAGVMFVSGFVSTNGKWDKFDAEWTALLTRNGIENPFHMTEFKAGAGKLYEKWRNKPHEQRTFELEAIKVIDRFINKEFTQGLVVEDFARMHREYEIPSEHLWSTLINKPLCHCGVSTIVGLVQWMERQRMKRKVHSLTIIFDRGEEHRGELTTAIRTSFGVTPEFKDKKDFLGLQAADMLAWYHARATGDAEYKRTFHLGPQYQVLVKWMRDVDAWGYANWKSLSGYCDDQGFAKRIRQEVV